ncbi:MAG: glycosyltransferase [Lachnospiraceae bacterium]|jgi:glycosyltransferase involved in cell wall biosynthesis|nr:glycosyltransferase [Lachnospiraceae bacterium]
MRKNHIPFSVLMSLYINEKAEYFRECMESVLNQTVPPKEIVIVKDGPISEEVESVLQQYINNNLSLIKVVAYTPNKGLGYALNKGIKACSNELIARMDTDDIARRDRFEKQLQKFELNPNLDICGSQIDEFEDTPDRIVAKRSVPTTDKEIKEYQKRRDSFNHMTVMYKKSAVLKAGNYQPCLLMEDTYLWVRMILTNATCMNCDESLVYVRIGKGMYERRGGWKYFRKYKDGRKKIYDTGYISISDYYYTLGVQFCFALMPSYIRGLLYKKILHNK